jgi:hypothetical protein
MRRRVEKTNFSKHALRLNGRNEGVLATRYIQLDGHRTDEHDIERGLEVACPNDNIAGAERKLLEAPHQLFAFRLGHIGE